MLNFTTLKNRSARCALTAIACFLAGSLLTPTSAAAAEYYAAPNGSSSNDGSVSRPLDLATALSASSPAGPGDTIWLRDGRYLGTFVSDLEGSPTAPIVVRQYPGERAVIDAVTGNRNTPALEVRGSDVWYWGFEVTDSNPVRQVTGGYNPPRATSVWVLGARTKFINMIVHDGEQGFGFWNPAVDAELYGNLIYNVGFDSNDRGHGHSIYVQNTSGTKRINDNILFNGFSFGIHAYTEGGGIDYVHMKGNTIFNHGVLSAASGAKANLYMGGGDDADFPVIQDNYLYYSPFESDGRNIDLRPSCNSGTVTGNYAAGGRVSIYCVGTTVTGNFFAGDIELDSAYPSNTYTANKPTAPRVFVRPNTYEPGARANITVFNWDRQPYVLVDLTAVGLPVGAQFEIRDAQNYFGNPVVAGVYTGASIVIPMTGLTVDPPVGQIPITPTHTAPEFGAFILVRSSGIVAPTGPTATFTVSPGSIAAGQSATLSWSTDNATSVVINQGIGAVTATGSRTVTPSTTTTYTLTATNASGTVSRPVTIQVLQNAAPVVSVSASGTSFTAPAAITLTASASDPGGSIKHVKFFAGSTELATDSTAPYSYLWTNVLAGTYVVTARATDNLDATTTSGAFNLTVGGGSAPGLGGLGGTLSTPSVTQNLSTLGTLDWAHWGLIAATSYNHKAGITPQISNVTAIGGSAVRYTGHPLGFSWSGGTPMAGATASQTGIYISGQNKGFKITVPADTTQRSLQVFVGVWKAQGRLVAHLSDGSAPDYVSTALSNTAGTSTGAFMLTYRAAGPGQTLTVTFTQDSAASGNITLQAAALSSLSTPLPDFSLSATPATRTVTAGAGTSYTLTVAPVNGFTGNVTLSATGWPAGTTGTFSPATVVGGTGTSTLTVTTSASTPSGVPTITITGTAGALLRTIPVTLAVATGAPTVGTGALGGTVGTPAGPQNLTTLGTLDWAHWGLTSGTSYNHKAGTTPQISNFTVVGTRVPQRYTDHPVGFSWSDGTPTASTTGSATGSYVGGVNNGFKIAVPADLTPRKLTIFVGVWRAQGRLVAHLSDGSAPDYVDLTLNNAGGTAAGMYTLTYQAASPGQTLTVTFTQANATSGNVTLQAAALAAQ